MPEEKEQPPAPKRSSRSGRRLASENETLPLDTGGAKAPARRQRPRKAAESKVRPAKPPAASDDSVGEELERRVARVEFAEGAFVRTRVPVRADAKPGRDVLTDMDILSLDIDLRLRGTRSVLECKSGTGQAGEADRLFWLAGFQRYLNVERAVLVRETTTSRGVSLARHLGLHLLNAQILSERESANAWIPDRFAHVGADPCRAAEKRTDTQIRGVAAIPPGLLAFLRFGVLLAESHEVLGALSSLGEAVRRATVLPDPAGVVIAGHALIGTILAGIQDASRAEMLTDEQLRRRLELSFTAGNPDDTYVLEVLGRADELVRAQVEDLHRAYVESGAPRIPHEFPSLRSTVGTSPSWTERYLDFVRRLRTTSSVARDLLQTAELAVFDALMGSEAWKADAFSHLFTPEHRSLLLAAVRVLGDIVDPAVAERLGRLRDLPFDRSAPLLPERRQPLEEAGSPDASIASQEDGPKS